MGSAYVSPNQISDQIAGHHENSDPQICKI